MTARGDFWARRKAAVQSEREAEEKAIEARKIAEERAELEEKSDEEILAELGLPDPDTLEPGTDVADFMKAAVPDRLRRRALRRLWRINPVLANVDGLVDYGEDFTDAATVVENLQTAYQVGKGMLRHVEEMARQAAEAEAEAEAGATWVVAEAQAEDTTGKAALPGEDVQPENVPPETLAPETLADTAPETTRDQSADHMPAPATAEIAAPQDTPPPYQIDTQDPEMTALPRRRLRFAFEDSST